MKYRRSKTTPGAVASVAAGFGVWSLVRSTLLLGLVIGTFGGCVFVPVGGDGAGYYSRGYYHHEHDHHGYDRGEYRPWG